MTCKKICCFGELLLRFSPVMQGEFIKRQSTPVYIGGAELNVATALTKWKLPVTYLTALPGNHISEEIIQYIHKSNIQTENIKICGERIGTYYLPQGSDMKNQSVVYDRDHSSFSTLKPGEINWEDVLQDVDWFHLSAISPALNANIAALCLEGVKAAAKRNITISIDLNYRAKLWQYGQHPHSVMPEIIGHCNVIMGNIWSADKLLGVGFNQEFLNDPSDEKYIIAANESSISLKAKFPSCCIVAYTFRFDVGAGIKYFATLHTQNKNLKSSVFNSNEVTDKVGSGDCFMGGLIYGLYNQLDEADVIEFAAAAAYLKLFQSGDATSNSVSDIKSKMYHA